MQNFSRVGRFTKMLNYRLWVWNCRHHKWSNFPIFTVSDYRRRWSCIYCRWRVSAKL